MPQWICHQCGTKFCIAPVNPGATFSVGKCQCCGLEDIPCTEPRDYGGFKVWPLPPDIDPLPNPKTLDDLIEPTLDSFDFQKVQRCMKLLDWQWVGHPGEPFDVPSVDRIRETARRLLVNVVRSRTYNVTGTGGLWAEKIVNEIDPLDNGLVLKFILENSESYFGDYLDEIN